MIFCERGRKGLFQSAPSFHLVDLFPEPLNDHVREHPVVDVVEARLVLTQSDDVCTQDGFDFLSFRAVQGRH